MKSLVLLACVNAADFSASGQRSLILVVGMATIRVRSYTLRMEREKLFAQTVGRLLDFPSRQLANRRLRTSAKISHFFLCGLCGADFGKYLYPVHSYQHKRNSDNLQAENRS